MNDFLKKSVALTASISTAAFTLLPEDVFKLIELNPKWTEVCNTIIMRVISVLAVFMFSTLAIALYRKIRQSVTIKGKNYKIKIEYGDIFEIDNCKKVIPFDECYTLRVGEMPSDINASSLCGQYLRKYSIEDMQPLIDAVHLVPAKSKSHFQHMTRYESGKLVPNGDYLLMSFAKLDESGLGRMSRDEYIESLSVLWQEIDKYYGQRNICIPILGSGVTRIDGVSMTQQELLDMMIWSYKLSNHKIKNPYSLIIVCKKQEGFSLNRIEESTL
ncbi:MAG: DUF6430 domain-containing protein [Eubacteriales bacterium]|nr:DUF6430 domain-containing protein [Eubacteriales bacterium]